MTISTGTDDFAWSVRMRAAADGADGPHLSGSERLVRAKQLDETVDTLLKRGSRADPAFLQITVEKVDAASIQRTELLPITTVICRGSEESRSVSRTILAESGISQSAFDGAWDLISRPDTSIPMRGAALFSKDQGNRLEENLDRGVRATRMDYLPEESEPIAQAFADAGLAHFRTREALLVATKVLWSGVIGELCWSDDTSYRAGYIATVKHGYVRIPDFKPAGALGGRVFFVDPNDDIAEIVRRLEGAPLWAGGPLVVRPTLQASDLRQRT